VVEEGNDVRVDLRVRVRVRVGVRVRVRVGDTRLGPLFICFLEARDGGGVDLGVRL
jgi:hypothetical protein